MAIILEVMAVKLQQHLPFTVLKLSIIGEVLSVWNIKVATALTVYGIETLEPRLPLTPSYSVATALTVYGIETILLE